MFCAHVPVIFGTLTAECLAAHPLCRNKPFFIVLLFCWALETFAKFRNRFNLSTFFYVAPLSLPTPSANYYCVRSFLLTATLFSQKSTHYRNLVRINPVYVLVNSRWSIVNAQRPNLKGACFSNCEACKSVEHPKQFSKNCLFEIRVRFDFRCDNKKRFQNPWWVDGIFIAFSRPESLIRKTASSTRAIWAGPKIPQPVSGYELLRPAWEAGRSESWAKMGLHCMYGNLFSVLCW